VSRYESYNRGCSAQKRDVETTFPHQIKRKTAPNSSNKVSIRLQEFPHWIFLFHCRLLTSSANLRVAGTYVRSQPCFNAEVPYLSLTMYPFSIPTDEHVPLQHFKIQACTPSIFRQMNMYPQSFLWQNILSWLGQPIFWSKNFKFWLYNLNILTLFWPINFLRLQLQNISAFGAEANPEAYSCTPCFEILKYLVV